MGKTFAIILIVLVAIAAAGFGNYQRNAHLDRDLQHRPYKTLSDADLEALAKAYEQQAEARRQQLARVTGDRTKVLDGYAPADLGGKLEAFESFQRRNDAWRELDRSRLEQESAVEAVKKEQRIRRAGLHREKNRILRRLLTF